ncbi:sugar kinase [Parenemella sanctibonifatiensis]|uniref:2-keto-3-deoxygluconate kinase n=1 Tax=Parenemella sanctibonifatiensis TaxID=2016505 RepID=A0A255EH68_9ACTN|nr:sugar kinase [Parenemella sanctibonifatiensis]OYN90889.1 2-keto-3-deoxygluconate kinase [Parenemella sanctibonifatiensis]
MKLREDAQWSLVVPTSMGIRITPENRQPVHVADRFTMQVTSAETNVASVPSYLGLPVKVLTNFVEGSPISAMIKANLRARNMAYEGPDVPQGDPWGYRHQINIADSGFGGRGPRVWNDRAGEVGRTLKVEDFDLDRIFGEEGVKILHISGLVAALSPDTSKFCVELAQAAKKHGTLVSMDLNYRASFWEGRQEELSAAFHAIANECNILIGNEEDFQLALGIEGPPAGGAGIDAKIEGFKEMIGRIRQAFPNAEFFATTLREVVSANEHEWGMIVYGDGGFHVADLRPIQVLDRIGGGDGSVGGMLYGILQGWPAEKCMQFGWATGALAATSATDYGAPADEDQVWSIWSGNARVKR